MQMLDSLDRLAALPGDTRVCCGHEYTVANAAFALAVDPANAALQRPQRAKRSACAWPASRRCRPRSATNAPAIRSCASTCRRFAARSPAHVGRALLDRVGRFRRIAALERRVPRMRSRRAPGVRPCREPRARGAGRIGDAAQEIPNSLPPPPRQTPADDLLAPRNRAQRPRRSTPASAKASPIRAARPAAAQRWRKHFANAPRRMASATRRRAAAVRLRRRRRARSATCRPNTR